MFYIQNLRQPVLSSREDKVRNKNPSRGLVESGSGAFLKLNTGSQALISRKAPKVQISDEADMMDTHKLLHLISEKYNKDYKDGDSLI